MHRSTLFFCPGLRADNLRQWFRENENRAEADNAPVPPSSPKLEGAEAGPAVDNLKFDFDFDFDDDDDDEPPKEAHDTAAPPSTSPQEVGDASPRGSATTLRSGSGKGVTVAGAVGGAAMAGAVAGGLAAGGGAVVGAMALRAASKREDGIGKAAKKAGAAADAAMEKAQ